jgi:hypothetical protein
MGPVNRALANDGAFGRSIDLDAAVNAVNPVSTPA